MAINLSSLAKAARDHFWKSLKKCIIDRYYMEEAYRRHDILDRVLSLLEPHLPGREEFGAEELKTIANLLMQDLRKTLSFM